MLNLPIPYNRYNEIVAIINNKNSSEYKNYEKYITALKGDLEKILIEIYSAIFYGDILTGKIVPSCKFNLITALDNLSFGAHLSLMPHDQANISVSLGTIITLDDLFLRLCCNQDILSHDFDDLQNLKRVWNGTTCFWPERGGSAFPNIRYNDYTSKVIYEPLGKINSLIKFDNPLGFTSIFFSGIPKGDHERIKLAITLVNIGLAWILAHEEGHFWEGHTHFMVQTYRENSIFEVNIEKQSASTDDPLLNGDSRRKLFEWRADNNAIDGVIDVVLHGNPDFFFSLPEYCQSLEWRVRILIFAVGAVIFLFEKARILKGSAKNYPSPKTRFVVMLARLIEVIKINKRVNIPDKVLIGAISLAMNDLIVASDLYFALSDYDESIIKDKILNYERGKSHDDLLKQEQYQDSLKIFEQGKEEEIVQTIIGALFYNKIEHHQIDTYHKWFDEFNEIHDSFHDNKIEAKMKFFRKKTLIKGHIYSADRDFDFL